MTNEPVPAVPEQNKPTFRQFAKFFLTWVIGSVLIVASYAHVVSWVQAYSDSYYQESMDSGGNPLAANDEAAMGELFLLLAYVGVCMGIAALIVFAFMRLFWRKKPDQPARDIIRVRGS